MNYEQKYNDALDAARHIYDDMKSGGNFGGMEDLEVIFPELRESEDERIRKEILDYIKVNYHWANKEELEQRRRFLAYLEKQKELPFVKDVIPGFPGLYFYDGERMHFQGNPAMEENPYDFAMSQQEEKQKEQKPVEWSAEDETNGWAGVNLERYLSCLQRLGTGNSQQSETINSKWFKEHCRPQPKQEWNEEDEYIINTLIHHYELINPTSSYFDKVPKERFLAWLKSLRPSWKPSEEQMKALDYVAGRFTGSSKVFANFMSLYDDLKKLM